MHTVPMLEVLICTYNNAALLDRALECLERQRSTDDSWSVLVIDNNSTDDTPAVVDKYRAAGRIPGLRRVFEPEQGLAKARLRGVRESAAHWIGLVDDDCFVDEEWVRQALRFAREHPDCGAFGGKNVLLWEMPPSDLVERYGEFYARRDLGPTPLVLGPRATLAGAGMVINRSALERTGWLEAHIMAGRQGKTLTACGGEDEEIVLRLRKAGYALRYTPDCVLLHFITRRRISERYLIDLFFEFGASRSRLLRLVSHEGRLIGVLAYWTRVLKWGALALGSSLQANLGVRSKNESRAFTSFLRGLWAARP